MIAKCSEVQKVLIFIVTQQAKLYEEAYRGEVGEFKNTYIAITQQPQSA